MTSLLSRLSRLERGANPFEVRLCHLNEMDQSRLQLRCGDFERTYLREAGETDNAFRERAADKGHAEAQERFSSCIVIHPSDYGL